MLSMCVSLYEMTLLLVWFLTSERHQHSHQGQHAAPVEIKVYSNAAMYLP